MKNIIKSLKFIFYLSKYSQDNYPNTNIIDDSYEGLDGGDAVPLKILSRINCNDKNTIIIFPGASSDAEKHPGLLFLGSIICKLGYRVIIPCIPPLKNLKIDETCFNWFAHAYSKIIERDDIKEQVSAMALSFGGAILLGASLDKRIINNPPKSIMTFGTYSDIQTTLNFLCSGMISINKKTYNIKPHNWGLMILLHNFLDKLNFEEIKNYKIEIKKIIVLKILDKDQEAEKEVNKLPNEPKFFINKIFNSNVTKDISIEIERVIGNEKVFINKMSPKYWGNKVKSKVFIMHGSNDSMVPFTESINLGKYIKNSSLFISYIYEHKEISTNKGLIFKLKEFYKMFLFFKKYFKYNAS